jgi:4-aminobutyrate aminotransferase/(S)-3-amino-2-methylpropionate transaminase
VVARAKHLGEVACQRMSDWAEKYEIVTEVRGLGLLLGVSFRAGDVAEDYYWARSVRDQMLRMGVWAICDSEPQVRLYPALNMDESVLLEGLDIMEAAIDSVNRSGVTVGDYPALPSGNVGF